MTVPTSLCCWTKALNMWFCTCLIWQTLYFKPKVETMGILIVFVSSITRYPLFLLSKYLQLHIFLEHSQCMLYSDIKEPGIKSTQNKFRIFFSPYIGTGEGKTKDLKRFALNIPRNSRSQWPRGLRYRSAAARLLRLWVWNPPGTRLFICCKCYILSGRMLCDELSLDQESYQLWCVVVCDLETSWMSRAWPKGRLSHHRQTNKAIT